MELTDRREAIIRRHKTLASVPGSGWHKNDPAELKRVAAGEMPLADRVVAFIDDDRVRVVGACADRVRAALAAFADAAAKELAALPPGVAAPHMTAYAAKIAKRVAESAGDISVGTQEWNAATHALSRTGTQCVMADANNTPDDE